MKYLAIIFLSIFAIGWFYISWFILKDFQSSIFFSNQTKIVTAILLAGIFSIWFLLSKLTYKNEFYNIPENIKLDETKLEKDFFLPKIKKIDKLNKYKNYENDSIITKDSIDIILDDSDESINQQIITENKINNNNGDNFKIIEWIWPKIEELLNNNWISTYNILANTEIEKLKEILSNANKRYIVLHNPSTWPKQAKIANTWNLKDLKIYQSKLVKWIEK